MTRATTRRDRLPRHLVLSTSAIWPDGGYDEGTYQEMALLPDGWSSNDPLPYIGHWKQSDPSLSSIGSVSGATFKVDLASDRSGSHS